LKGLPRSIEHVGSRPRSRPNCAVGGETRVGVRTSSIFLTTPDAAQALLLHGEAAELFNRALSLYAAAHADAFKALNPQMVVPALMAARKKLRIWAASSRVLPTG
jgi:hypothetical protein